MRIEYIAVPILMVCDYYLTLLGNIYRKKKYGEHFIIETYELNPVWKKDVDKIKWINYRHLILVVLMTVFFYFLSLFGNEILYNWLSGFFLTLFGMINGRHISNLFLFKYVSTHPAEISGKVYMNHQLTLKISQYQLIILAVPILILTIRNPNSFNIGGLSSCILLFIAHLIWLIRYKKGQEKKNDIAIEIPNQ